MTPLVNVRGVVVVARWRYMWRQGKWRYILEAHFVGLRCPMRSPPPPLHYATPPHRETKQMANLDVAQALRRLADDVEVGQYENWIAQLNVSRSPVELSPMAGECELDNLRHFRAGDVVDVTLVLTKAS